MNQTAKAMDAGTGKALFENGKWIWEKSYPEGLSWNAPVLQKPLFHIIDMAAEKYGSAKAIDFMGRTWSYKNLAAKVDKIAQGLQKIGVKKGDKIGLLLPNTPYSIFFYFGILKAGATVVNYNPLYVEKELAGQIEDSETDIMVTVDLKLTCDKMMHALQSTRLKKVIVCPFAGALPFPKNMLFNVVKAADVAHPPRDARFVFYKDLVNNPGKPELPVIDAQNDIAVLQYTGGTTGIPKGAALTHGNIYANTMQTAHWVRNAVACRDSIVGVLPFFHVFAMTAVMNWSLWSGVKILMLPKFDLDDVFKMIKKHKPNFFPAVPAIFNALASHADVGKYDFSCLKFCFSGGAPLPMDVKRLFEEKTGSRTIAEGYGLTESSPVVTANPVGGRVKAGSIGLPIPGTIVEIISRDDNSSLMPVGEKGEVCVRGPQVMQGYYKKPDETAKVLRNGRLHTGDVGYMDEEGYVYLVDRIKDLILVRGYNVYPRVVEEAIYLHPSVEECIVAGVPDEERGETVWAWVKPAAGRSVNEHDLHEFLKDKLNPIEYPRKIIVRDQPLPKTAVGKLSRKDLLIQEGIKKG